MSDIVAEIWSTEQAKTTWKMWLTGVCCLSSLEILTSVPKQLLKGCWGLSAMALRLLLGRQNPKSAFPQGAETQTQTHTGSKTRHDGKWNTAKSAEMHTFSIWCLFTRGLNATWPHLVLVRCIITN
jgi:hypothetical protein